MLRQVTMFQLVKEFLVPNPFQNILDPLLLKDNLSEILGQVPRNYP